MPNAIRNKRSRRAKSDRKPKFQADLVPFVRTEWTEKELARLAKLLRSEPAKPTNALISAMKD